VGFVEAEGCFHISVYRSLKSKQGYAVKLKFIISQHTRDKQLLLSFTDYLGCGRIFDQKYRRKERSVSEFIVTKIRDIVDNIIPFFEKHPVIGSKHHSYINFKSAVDMIKNKEHLALDGKRLEKILQLKNSMYVSRDYRLSQKNITIEYK
jgi:hypothetical protein